MPLQQADPRRVLRQRGFAVDRQSGNNQFWRSSGDPRRSVGVVAHHHVTAPGGARTRCRDEMYDGRY